MPRRRIAWLKTLFAVLAAFAVFAVSRVSFAATADAPLCDDRGATMLAPPPTLVFENTLIDVAARARDADCPDDDAEGLSVRGPGGEAPAPSPISASSSDGDAVMPPHVALIRDAGALVVRARGVRVAAPSGVRDRVERPPRP